MDVRLESKETEKAEVTKKLRKVLKCNTLDCIKLTLGSQGYFREDA
jgi:hypothetical protein